MPDKLPRQWTLKQVLFNGKPATAIYGPAMVVGEIVEVTEQTSTPYRDKRGARSKHQKELLDVKDSKEQS